MKLNEHKLPKSESHNYDKIDALNGYIKYVLQHNEHLKLHPYVSLKEVIEEATRVAQASGIELKKYYVNQTVNGHKIIQQ